MSLKKSKIEIETEPESPADALAAADFLKILDRALIEKSERLPVFDQTILAVAKLAPKVPEIERTAILATLPALKNCREQVLAHTEGAAREAWLAHLEEMAAKLASGATLAQSEGRNRRDFEEDYASKMECAKAAGVKACTAFLDAIKLPIARLIQHADALAEKVENDERKAFAEFGVTFEPSNLVRAIRAVGNLARLRNPSYPQWGTNPAEILIFLNLE